MNHSSQPNSKNTDADKQQLPLKTYFLNKYQPIKNQQPTSVESLNLDLSSQNFLPYQDSFSTNLFNPTNNSISTVKQQLPHQQHQQQQQQHQSFNLNTSMAAKRHFSGSNSSLQNSDDEDDDYDNELLNGGQSKSREEKRRLSHTAAEQKRRNAIKQGYELLKARLPTCQQTDPYISMRITRATTLEQTIDYIHELEKEKDKHEQELDSLKKEIIALKIMKSNYEEILQYHRNMPKDNSVEINDEAKFDLFVKFSDNLFQSFSSMINTNTFSELTSSTLNWLEQMCSANNLKNLVLLSLFQVTQQMLH